MKNRRKKHPSIQHFWTRPRSTKLQTHTIYKGLIKVQVKTITGKQAHTHQISEGQLKTWCNLIRLNSKLLQYRIEASIKRFHWLHKPNIQVLYVSIYDCQIVLHLTRKLFNHTMPSIYPTNKYSVYRNMTAECFIIKLLWALNHELN